MVVVDLVTEQFERKMADQKVLALVVRENAPGRRVDRSIEGGDDADRFPFFADPAIVEADLFQYHGDRKLLHGGARNHYGFQDSPNSGRV